VNSEEMKERTKKFAVQVIKFVDGLEPLTTLNVLSKQIVRSATSIGANYRAACGARSRAEFLAKLQIAREESDETLFWLELFQETNSRYDVRDLLQECDEPTAILTASLKTSRSHQ
jgi:four helix bundle protein